MKKVLLMLLCILAGAQTMKAQVAYVEYNTNTKYLTFYYDNRMDSREGVTYKIRYNDNNKPEWHDGQINEKVQRVVFDESFKSYRPTRTDYWFADMIKLQGIDHLDYLNTSEVKYMGRMFKGYPNRSLNLSSFDTSKVIDMEGMFYGCKSLSSLNISSFNTENVQLMYNMFEGCEYLRDLDLSNFKTNNLESASAMFSGCIQLKTLNLSGFSTDKLTNIRNMFYGCSYLEKITVGEKWDVSKISSENSKDMFLNCTKIVGGDGTKYDENHVDASYAHIDGGTSYPGYLSGIVEPYVNFYNGKLVFFYDGKRPIRSGTTYDLNKDFDDPGWLEVHSQVTSAAFDYSFAEVRPTTTCKWFEGCPLTSITGMQYLNTSEVTNMCKMFLGCSMKSIDLSKFDTRKVRTMQMMFAGCSSLESIDLSSFDTGEVYLMEYMFSSCSSLTSLDLTSFKSTSLASDYGVYAMFSRCTNLKTINFGYQFDLANIKQLDNMFNECSSLTDVNLKWFNTKNVNSMGYMFSGCSSLTTLDLSSFDTSNVTDMEELFNGCANLTTINVGAGWSTAKVVRHDNMFLDCTKIKGMAGTTYNASYVDKTYAHVDEGTSNPGYLSTKTYNLIVGGVRVTDLNRDNIPITSGTAKFSTGNVLYLTDAVIDGTLHSLYSSISNLTIIISGTCTLNRYIVMGSSASITGGKNSKLIVKSLISFNGTLEFQNAYTEVHAGSNTMFQGDGSTSKLRFGPNATLIGDNNGNIMSKVVGFTLESPTKFMLGMMGMLGSTVEYNASSKTLVVNNGSSTTTLTNTIAIGRDYNLWVGGTQVTSLNLDDVTGNRSVSYDEETSTLRLTGGSFTGQGTSSDASTGYGAGIYSEVDGLIIDVPGSVSVKSAPSSGTNPCSGMILFANTTINGDGQLSVSGYDGIVLGVGARALTVGGRVILQVTGNNSAGMRGWSTEKGSTRNYYSTLTVKGEAELRAKGANNMRSLEYWNDLVLEDNHAISTPEGAVWNASTHEVCDANGNVVKGTWVIIEKTAISYDLNGDGKVSTADIQVIINEMKKPQASQDMKYDLNNDGKVSTADIQVIINEMKK